MTILDRGGSDAAKKASFLLARGASSGFLEILGLPQSLSLVSSFDGNTHVSATVNGVAPARLTLVHDDVVQWTSLNLTPASSLSLSVVGEDQRLTFEADAAVTRFAIDTIGSFGYAGIETVDSSFTRLETLMPSSGNNGYVSTNVTGHAGRLAFALQPPSSEENARARLSKCTGECLNVNLLNEDKLATGYLTALNDLIWTSAETGKLNLTIRRNPTAATPPFEVNLLKSSEQYNLTMGRLPHVFDLGLRGLDESNFTYAADILPGDVISSYTRDGKFMILTLADGPRGFSYDAPNQIAPFTMGYDATERPSAISFESSLTPAYYQRFTISDGSPKKFQGSLTQGDCGVESPMKVAFTTLGEAGGPLDLVVSNTGTRARAVTGFDVDCQSAGLRTTAMLPDIPPLPTDLPDLPIPIEPPAVPLLGAGRDKCVAFVAIPSSESYTNHPTFAFLNGYITGGSQLESGKGSIIIEAAPGMVKYHTLAGDPLSPETGISPGIASWDLTYKPDDTLSELCMPFEGRPIKEAGFVATGMPSAITVKAADSGDGQAVISVDGSGPVTGDLIMTAFLGPKPAEEAGAAPKGSALEFHLNVPMAHVVARVTSDQSIETNAAAENEITLKTAGDLFHAFLELTGVQSISVIQSSEPDPDGCSAPEPVPSRMVITYVGSGGRDMESVTDDGCGVQRVRMEPLPVDMYVEVQDSAKDGLRATLRLEDTPISTLKIWQRKHGDQLDFYTAVDGIPTGSNEFGWLLGTAAGRIKALASNGEKEIGAVEFGVTWRDQPNVYATGRFERVRIHVEWDEDGDTRFNGLPAFLFLDSFRLEVGAFHLRLRSNDFGVGFHASADPLSPLKFNSYQLRTNPGLAIAEQSLEVVRAGAMQFNLLQHGEVFAFGQWWRIPNSVLMDSVPMCSDDEDNDSDNLVDYPNDSDCDTAYDDSEYDDSSP
jgi:hypothetical protein